MTTSPRCSAAVGVQLPAPAETTPAWTSRRLRRDVTDLVKCVARSHIPEDAADLFTVIREAVSKVQGAEVASRLAGAVNAPCTDMRSNLKQVGLHFLNEAKIFLAGPVLTNPVRC